MKKENYGKEQKGREIAGQACSKEDESFNYDKAKGELGEVSDIIETEAEAAIGECADGLWDEDEVEVMDFVGAIYGELIEMNRVLAEMLGRMVDEKEGKDECKCGCAKSKKDWGFTVDESGDGYKKKGSGMFGKVFGNH